MQTGICKHFPGVCFNVDKIIRWFIAQSTFLAPSLKGYWKGVSRSISPKQDVANRVRKAWAQWPLPGWLLLALSITRPQICIVHSGVTLALGRSTPESLASDIGFSSGPESEPQVAGWVLIGSSPELLNLVSGTGIRGTQWSLKSIKICLFVHSSSDWVYVTFSSSSKGSTTSKRLRLTANPLVSTSFEKSSEISLIYSDLSLVWIIKAQGHLGGSSWVTSSLDGRSWHSLIPQSWLPARGATLVVNEWNTTVLFSCLSVTCSKQTLITKDYLNPLASNPLIVCKYCCSVLKKNVLVRSNLSTSCWLLDCSSVFFPEPSVH